MTLASVPPPARAAPLVIRFGALGDMLLLTPLLRLLHARYRQPCTVVGSGGWLEPLFAGHPDVGKVWRLRSRTRPYWTDATQRAFVAWQRSQPPGPVYVGDGNRVAKLRWLLHRAHVPDAHCLFADTDCPLRHGDHFIDRWQRFGAMTPAAFVGAAPADTATLLDAPFVPVHPADRADLDAWLQARGLDAAPLVLLQPGSKRTLKRGRAGQPGNDKMWPLANWAGLIHAVLARVPDAKVVLCGAPPEAALLRAIARAAGSARVLAAGDELPPRRLLALCEHASAMISVDTGPAQVAAALGCPLIVLYGAQRPSLWLPRSPTDSAVLALGGLPQRARVDRIALAEVVAAWRSLPLRKATRRTACAG